MQIICANHLHVKKENWKEILCRQQEEGGNENIAKIGDYAKCPECSRIGRVVWISKDGVSAGIQCPASHRLTSRPASRFGTIARPRSKNSRNMVFIMEIK